ncbi:MAG: M1 family aminopeptidase [Verrucomicrobiales bacterium]
MKFSIRFGLLLLLPLLFSLNAREFHASFLKPGPDSPEYRKYAPERRVDILHLALDVTPNFKERTVSGTMTLSFRPIVEPLKELRLDGVDLKIEKVEGATEVSSWENNDKEIVIHFAEAIPVGADSKVTVQYSAEPRKGLYFRTAEMGYNPSDEHIFTQGEDIEARHWYPCYDAPNDKFTSEITCHVPLEMTVLSNGRFISENKDEARGIKTVKWLQEQPHVNYLISLVAGKLEKIEDKYNDLPLAFYTPSSQIQYATNSFKETKEMMAFFEKEIGVPYPWAKYYQVCVQDFMWGGMENTSISTLTDATLFPDETENIRSSQRLVAHELAHQWFGDYVTTKDWIHIWLNEGFATYYEKLYTLHREGKDEFLYDMYSMARPWVNNSSVQDSMPTVYRNYEQALEMFGYTIYNKGAWILHMMRNEVGEETFRKAVKLYLDRHAFGNVTTPNLAQAFEEISGRSFDQFFDQWVYNPHHPELQVDYSWNEANKKATLRIRQVQILTNGVALFRVPLTVRFKGDFEAVAQMIEVKEKDDEFSFTLPKAPRLVRIDPDLVLLARIQFDAPKAMLLAQLKDESDLPGRIIAIEALEKIGDGDSLKALADRMNNDPFYGVRTKAIQALKKIHTPEVLALFLAATNQPDARVRQQIALGITSFYDERARDYVYANLEAEKNPEIREHLVAALGSYPDKQSIQTLIAELQKPSFQNKVADAAIGAMRAQNNPDYLSYLLAHVKKVDHGYSGRSLGRGLEALGYLARDEKEKGEIRELLLTHATSKRSVVRTMAINALGMLGDPKAIAPLEKIVLGSSREATERGPADRALAALRAGRRTPEEIQSLRAEVLELKRQNDELNKELKEINKKIELLKPTPSTPPPSAVKTKVKSQRK